MSRIVRIKSLLMQEISKIIQEDFRQNLGLISIVDMNVSKDLASATVYYSHFGSENEQRKSLEKINKATYFIHDQLNRRIRLKRIPILTFRRTNQLENGANVLNKMKSMNNDQPNT